MAYLGNRPADSYLSLEKQTFTTSATASYTLTNAVSNANEIALFLNNVRQEPTEAYTVSGTALTLSTAITSGDTMYCIYLGKSIGTINPTDGSVGLSQLSATGTKDATTFLRGDNTFASAGGANTPAFEASMGSNLTISGNTYTKATLNTEKFDIGSCYDSSTNYRFTPNVAGKYFMYGTYYVEMPNSNSNFVQCRIIKNGAIINGGVEVGLHASINSVISVTTQVVHEMNGSTDYLEFFLYQYDYNSGVSRDARGNNVDGRQFNIFGGYRIIE